MSSASFTEAARTAPASPTSSGSAQIDAAVDRVAAHKQTWVEVAIPQRIELLRRCLAGVLEAADDWVRDMVAVKGLIDVKELRHLWRVNRLDFAAA